MEEMQRIVELDLLSSSENDIIVDRKLAGEHGLKHAIIYSVLNELKEYNIKDIHERFPYYSNNAIRSSVNYWKGLGVLKKNDKSWEDIKKELLDGTHESTEVCEWCGDKVLCLHKHHFPIPREKGGVDMVNICPNCHYQFHYLERRFSYKGVTS